MRLLPIRSCRTGMKLARHIHNENGHVLLSAGMELTTSLIERLSHYGIDYVYIHDPRTDDIIIEDIVSEETRIRTIQEVRTTF